MEDGLTFKALLFIMRSLARLFKVKDIDTFFDRAFIVLKFIGFLVDMSVIIIVAVLFDEIVNCAIGFAIICLLRVKFGEHYDTWFSCFVMSALLFALYMAFCKYLSGGIATNILIAIMLGLLFIKWGEAYPVVKSLYLKVKNKIKR